MFLLSPASLSGQRAALAFNPAARFELARQLRDPGGARLGDVFRFLSGLYFRGKAEYGETFSRPPPGLPGALVMTPSEGLCSLDERVTLARLAAWATVPIEEGNERFTAPLAEQAAVLERAHGASTRFVLLGSIASQKYVRPLTRVFGGDLLFPSDFVGRGDMSRGALMLRCVRTGVELAYEPVLGARRHGARAPRVQRDSEAGKPGGFAAGLDAERYSPRIHSGLTGISPRKQASTSASAWSLSRGSRARNGR